MYKIPMLSKILSEPLFQFYLFFSWSACLFHYFIVNSHHLIFISDMNLLLTQSLRRQNRFSTRSRIQKQITTPENIMLSILRRQFWSLGKGVCTDNEATMVKTRRFVMNDPDLKDSRVSCYGCVDHWLNLLVTDILSLPVQVFKKTSSPL